MLSSTYEHIETIQNLSYKLVKHQQLPQTFLSHFFFKIKNTNLDPGLRNLFITFRNDFTSRQSMIVLKIWLFSYNRCTKIIKKLIFQLPVGLNFNQKNIFQKRNSFAFGLLCKKVFSFFSFKSINQ